MVWHHHFLKFMYFLMFVIQSSCLKQDPKYKFTQVASNFNMHFFLENQLHIHSIRAMKIRKASSFSKFCLAILKFLRMLYHYLNCHENDYNRVKDYNFVACLTLHRLISFIIVFCSLTIRRNFPITSAVWALNSCSLIKNNLDNSKIST